MFLDSDIGSNIGSNIDSNIGSNIGSNKKRLAVFFSRMRYV